MSWTYVLSKVAPLMVRYDNEKGLSSLNIFIMGKDVS